MLRNDFIMRLVRDIGNVLLRVRKHKRDEDWEQADGELHDASKALIGLTPDALVIMDVDAILELVSVQGALEDERALWLARLLAEHGEVRAGADDHTGANAARTKAFCLFDELQRRGHELGEHTETFDSLVSSLE